MVQQVIKCSKPAIEAIDQWAEYVQNTSAVRR